MVKRTELLLFILVLPLFFGTHTDVKGSYVVAGVETPVTLTYDGELYQFVTYKTELLDAVTEQGFRIYDQDVFSVSRETKLNGAPVSVNVVKSLPVVINIDGEHTMGRTISGKAETILYENNIEFWPEDILSVELITDPIKQGGVGQLVTVKRAPEYKIKVDDKVKEVHTWATKVAEIVEKSETKLNPNDIVKPGLKEEIEGGGVITITRIEYAEISETDPIKFNTVYKGTTSLALGQTSAQVSGITGQKKNVYKVTYKNGEEVTRTLVTSKVTKVKRDAVILRGAVSGKCKWGPYYETNYGPYTTSFHYALTDRSYIGKYILVTNLSNGKSVKVKIVDAGPTNGLLDLSTTAIEAIGGMGGINLNGYFNVMVELL
ncbi:MAG: G5 domain-containing protein [Patescibacteria group bacterium]|nr:G5 domain-containing protein [Patescibacteria group bacterium]